jgi:hemerythrin superfamily protein
MTDTQPTQRTVDLIAEQHAEVRRLMGEIATGASDSRAETFQQLVRMLAVHETAEEMVVYPALRKLGEEGKRVAQARTAEEDEAKKVLARLEGMDPTSDAFQVQFLDFRSSVEQHASSEEANVFPLLEEAEREAGTRMRRAFELVERFAPTHAHRMAPESAIGNLLVGPFVSIVDRVRDAIRDMRSEKD